MGLAFSRIWERMFGKKEMRILMVGLDGHVLCGNQPVCRVHFLGDDAAVLCDSARTRRKIFISAQLSGP